MDAAQKQLLRAVVRRVHPDLFVGLPVEREQNSEALKVNALDPGYFTRGASSRAEEPLTPCCKLLKLRLGSCAYSGPQ